jgi:hypothetical protein
MPASVCGAVVKGSLALFVHTSRLVSTNVVCWLVTQLSAAKYQELGAPIFVCINE